MKRFRYDGCDAPDTKDLVEIGGAYFEASETDVRWFLAPDGTIYQHDYNKYEHYDNWYHSGEVEDEDE